MKKAAKRLSLLKDLKAEWTWLLKYIKRYIRQIIFYIIIGALSAALSLAIGIVSKYLIDAVTSHDEKHLLSFGTLVIATALFSILFNAGASWINARITTKTGNDIKEDIYSHIMLSDWQSISMFHSGELLNRIEGDVNTVAGGVISFIPSLVTRSLQFFGSLVIVLIYDKTMALLALLSAPFLFISSRFLLRTMRKFNKQSREVNGQVLSFSEESMQNLQLLKAFDLTRSYINNFSKLLGYYRTVKLNYEKFSILTTLALSLLGMIVSYICYGWGIYRLWQGAITFGTMTLFLSIAGNLSTSFSSLASLVPTAVTIGTSAGRVMEITDFSKERDLFREQALEIKKAAKVSELKIIAKDIDYSYTERKQVLNKLNFEVRSGETLALIGASGGGKTTVLRLLLGLISPTDGSLLVTAGNGEPIPMCDSTRRLCSYVPQEKSVLSGTLADNLRLGKSDATDEDMLAVIELAQLLEFVQSLPNGLNTQVGEKGINLSQGQAQRVSIARALLRDAPILIMDEATGALDIETEGKLLEAVMTSNKNRICIITTHRESMLKYADIVIEI